MVPSLIKIRASPLLHLEPVLIDLLVLDHPDVLRDRNQLAGPDEDAAGAVEFHQIGISVVKDPRMLKVEYACKIKYC